MYLIASAMSSRRARGLYEQSCRCRLDAGVTTPSPGLSSVRRRIAAGSVLLFVAVTSQ